MGPNRSQIQPDFSILTDLTILIPTFNCAKFARTAISSALHSAAKRILIADDGSGPETLEVLRRLVADHPDRLSLIASPTNRGAAENLNEAARQIDTPFFAKLDGDDVLYPGYLESAFPIIASHPKLAILAGHEVRVDAEHFNQYCPDEFPQVRSNGKLSILSGPDAYRFILKWQPNPTSSGTIYRTSAFRDVGGFDSGIDWGEDWEIWLRFAKYWEVGYLHSPSALYRIHPQSTTSRAIQENRLCFGYDAVYRRALAACDDPSIRPLIRRKMLYVFRLYAAAAVRQARVSLRDAAEYLVRAGHAFQAALLPAPASGARGGGGSARATVGPPGAAREV